MAEPTLSQWHLSKSVPVGLILGLVLQGAGVIWFFSSLDSRVEHLEKVSDKTSRVLEEQDDVLNEVRLDVAVIRQILEDLPDG